MSTWKGDLSDGTRYGRMLEQFVQNTPVRWGEGSKLTKTNPRRRDGFRCLVEVCVVRLAKRGELPGDNWLVKWAGVGERNGDQR